MTHPIPSSNSGDLIRQLRSVSKWCCIFQHEGQARHGTSEAPTEAATLIEHLEHEKAELLRQIEAAREMLSMFVDAAKPRRADGFHEMPMFSATELQLARQALSNISGQG